MTTIELKNLSIGYEYGNPVLSNINYTFQDNKIYGIIGKSGLGKSTLLQTIAGLEKPLDGEILFNGEPLRSARENDIMMLFQNYTCFDWLTELDNVLIAKRVKGKVTPQDITLAKAWLQRVGLGENKYPTQLSGGMRQRLALARTLFMNPAVVLMDEPLSALDEKTRKDMQDLIIADHANDKNIIIMVTHSTEEAERVCDIVIDLNKFKEVQ